jgi:hypothetical protein
MVALTTYLGIELMAATGGPRTSSPSPLRGRRPFTFSVVGAIETSRPGDFGHPGARHLGRRSRHEPTVRRGLGVERALLDVAHVRGRIEQGVQIPQQRLGPTRACEYRPPGAQGDGAHR